MNINLWQARSCSSVLLGTAVSVLMKTEHKQSLNDQIQIFQSSTVEMPWICPGCYMKIGSQTQNGINRELPLQSSHVGPQKPGLHWKLQLNSSKQHPAVSHSHIRPPALMGCRERERDWPDAELIQLASG